MLNTTNTITMSMAFKFDCGVMKVGNSIVLVLPKSLCDNFGIKDKMRLSVLATESGMIIPLKQKKDLKNEIDDIIKESRKQ